MCFFLLAAAALSASISGVEIPTAYVMRRMRWPRRRAAFAVGATMFLAGIPASLGFGLWADMSWHGRNILESTDYLVSNVLLPSGGLLTALLVGWRWSAPALRETALEGGRLGRLWIALLKFVIPPLIVAIFLRAVGLI